MGRYARFSMEMLEPRLIQSICHELRRRGFSPHSYKYKKGDKEMFELFLYGVAECKRIKNEIGLLGAKGWKLGRFLRSKQNA